MSQSSARGVCLARGLRDGVAAAVSEVHPSPRVDAQSFQNRLLGLDVGGDRLTSQSGGAHVRAGSLVAGGMAAELDDLAVECDQSWGLRALCMSWAQMPNAVVLTSCSAFRRCDRPLLGSEGQAMSGSCGSRAASSGCFLTFTLNGR